MLSNTKFGTHLHKLTQLLTLHRAPPKFSISHIPSTKLMIINQQILAAKNDNELLTIMRLYGSQMNAVNISTLLRRVRVTNHDFIQNKTRENLREKLFAQLKQKWEVFTPITEQNKRALVGVISSLGNLRSTVFNEEIYKTDIFALLKLVNNVEAMLLCNGILDLQLNQTFQSIYKDEVEELRKSKKILAIVQNQKEIQKLSLIHLIILQRFSRKDDRGYIISIWRNLIKNGLSNQIMNRFLAQLTINGTHIINFEDYIYMLHCYDVCKEDLAGLDILKQIKKYPCHKPRIEKQTVKFHLLSILFQTLGRNPQFKKTLWQGGKLQDEFSFKNIILRFYLKSLRTKQTQLRNISNSFHFLKQLQGDQNFNMSILNQTTMQFLITIGTFYTDKPIESYSFTSIFTEVLTIYEKKGFNGQEARDQLEFFVEQIQKFILKAKLEHIEENFIYQLLYGLIIYRKMVPEYEISDQLGELLAGKLQQMSPTLGDINRTYGQFKVLKSKSKKVCQIGRQLMNKFRSSDLSNEGIDTRRLTRENCFLHPKTSKLCNNCFQQRGHPQE